MSIYVHKSAQYDAMSDADFEYIETTIRALRKRYPALEIEVDPWWPDKTREERSLRRMKRWLMALGNHATYTRWFRYARDASGMSQTTFDRWLRELRDHGYVTVDYEGQGGSYSWVKPDDRPKGVQSEGAEGTATGGVEGAATQKETTVVNYGSNGRFGDQRDPIRRRKSKNGVGAPEPSIGELQGLVVDEK
jgi:DNA-binding transcriptional ArsR family regulator